MRMSAVILINHLLRRLVSCCLLFAGSSGGGGGVIVPMFGDAERDAAAVACLRSHFPTREVVPLAEGRVILVGGGNVHCITKQQAA